LTQTDSLIDIAKAVRKYKDLAKYNQLQFYRPYDKQREFHRNGLDYSQRCLGAGNQLGKTLAGSREAAYHLTGLYPDWWDGLRFEKPVVMWVGGVTGSAIRDSTQKLLFGRYQDPDSFGSGAVPRSKIVGVVNALGTPGLYDHAKVKHITGGTSLVFFKSYEQGRTKFQAETIDFWWPDEEPPPDIYAEGLTRTNKGQKGQRSMLTFTPLLGMTEVVRQFYEKPSKHQKLTMMTIWDVDHYTDAEREQIIMSYQPHERDARSKGIPVLGSGRVFPISEDDIKVEPFKIPRYWPRIKGMDFGTDHPTALACCCWDRDNDVFYVYDEYTAKAEMATPSFFAPVSNRKGEWIPVAWPHDGLKHDTGSYEEIAQQYKDAGMNMLYERATFEDGGNGVEAGLKDMLDRMLTGRWKVFSNCVEWFEEFRLYHRKDGKIVKIRDDLISASRYALMAKRHAETEPNDDDFDIPRSTHGRPLTGY
jgi:phage terminase large subunit-like protein